MRLVRHVDEDTGESFTYDADRVALCQAAEKLIRVRIQPFIADGDDPEHWLAAERDSEPPGVIEAVRAQFKLAHEEIKGRPAWQPWEPWMSHEVVRLAREYFAWEVIDELRQNEPRPGAR